MEARNRSRNEEQKPGTRTQQKPARIFFDFTYLSSHPGNHTGIQRVVRSLYQGLKGIVPTSGISEIIPVALIEGVFYRIPDRLIAGTKLQEEQPRRSPARGNSSSAAAGQERSGQTHRGFSSNPDLHRIHEVRRNVVAKLRASEFPTWLNMLLRAVRRPGKWLAGRCRIRQFRLRKLEPSAGDCFLSGDTAWDEAGRFWNAVDQWRRQGVLIVSVFYDALPYMEPQYFLNRNVKLWTAYYLRALRSVDVWAAISETAKADFAEMYAQEQSQELAFAAPAVFSFPLGANLDHRPHGGAEDPDSSSPHPQTYFLCVGSLDARKGHDVLLDAFSHYSGESHLIIIGRDIGRQSQTIADRILGQPSYGKSLFWIRDATDRELASWYQHSVLVICPSRAEGFGLPLIEAAYYDKPVVANRIPIFEEVGASYGLDIQFYERNQSRDLARCLSCSAATNHARSNRAKRPIPDWSAAAAGFLNGLRAISGFPDQG